MLRQQHDNNSEPAHGVTSANQQTLAAHSSRASVLFLSIALTTLICTVGPASAAPRPFAAAKTALFRAHKDQILPSGTKLTAITATGVTDYVASQVASHEDYVALRKEFRRYRGYLAQGDILAKLEKKPEFAALLLRKNLLKSASDTLAALRVLAVTGRFIKGSIKPLQRLSFSNNGRVKAMARQALLSMSTWAQYELVRTKQCLAESVSWGRTILKQRKVIAALRAEIAKLRGQLAALRK